MRFRQIALLFLLSFGSANSALAQSPNGTISGLVLDSSRAVIVGAEITIVNDATHAQFSAKTISEGIYVVPNLPPGSYCIQVAKIGFKTVKRATDKVIAGSSVALNHSLIPLVSRRMRLNGRAGIQLTELADQPGA